MTAVGIGYELTRGVLSTSEVDGNLPKGSEVTNRIL